MKGGDTVEQAAFRHTRAILKRYGDSGRYKLVCLAGHQGKKGFVRKNLNDCKLENSLSRTKSCVLEIALCNMWDWFVTLTLAPDKFDRYDLPAWRKSFTQWLRNYNRLHNTHIAYLLIPEQHKDGAWHMHGLLSGVPDAALIVNEHGYMDWPAYSRKYGFISMGKVRDLERVSKYITKYVTKDMAARAEDLHAHLYYASKGLKRAEVLHDGFAVFSDAFTPDFRNDYMFSAWLGADWDTVCEVFDRNS